MPLGSRFITPILVVLMALPGSWAWSADPASVVGTAEIDAALTNHLARERADRATIVALLQRDEVKGLASRHGLDLRRAQTAVATLQGEELRELAASAAVTDARLAGGDPSIRISLVAALLIVIILILLLD